MKVHRGGRAQFYP